MNDAAIIPTRRARVFSQPVDWWRVITDLGYAGYTRAAVGVAVGVSKSTIHGWHSGATPRHGDGEALIELWASATGNSRESVPRVRR